MKKELKMKLYLALRLTVCLDNESEGVGEIRGWVSMGKAEGYRINITADSIKWAGQRFFGPLPGL